MTRVFGIAAVAVIATLASAPVLPVAGETPGGSTVDIYPGQNAQAIVNSYPAGQDFRLKAGMHENFSVKPKKGNGFYGEAGTVLDGNGWVDYAFYHNNSGTRPDDVTIEGLNIDNKMVVRDYDNGGGWQAGTFNPGGALRWTLRSLNVSGAYGRGVSLGNYMTVENSDVHDNGVLGIGGICFACRIENNFIYQNNLGKRGDPDWEAGGIKIAYSNSLSIRKNRVANNNGPGIWVDLNSRRIDITGNTVWYNTRSAIFYEVSFDGAIVDNWVENSNRTQKTDWLYGNIDVTDSQNVTIARNTSWYPARDHIVVRATNRTDAGGPVDKVYVYGNRSVGPGRTGAGRCCGATMGVFSRDVRFQVNRYESHGSWVWNSNYSLTFTGWQSYGHDLAQRPASETTTTTTTTTTTAPTTTKATTRPVGSAPLSDAEAAARVKRSSWEPRPENATPNQRVPTSTELANFRSVSTNDYKDKITGNFTGTTDEIIQWAAHKWGIDEDIARAVAVKESWWRMSTVGDGGISYGLMQIKSTVAKGTHPLSEQSTAFNVDYWAASVRSYFDGNETWLNDPCCFSGTTYKAGDIWGSVGAWFSGRWYTDASVSYVNSVRKHMADRTWEQPGF